MKLFEDIAIGERDEIGKVTFTAGEIKAFAAEFDPQPFHLDEEAAARSHFGALCASGWQTVALWMRCMVAYRQREDEALRARGATPARNGPAVGFRDLKWIKPVYVGDTVTYSVEIVAKRESASRPGWGLVTTRGSGVNQHGEPVFSFDTTAFVQARGE
jgi:acyl dehydratase